MEILLGLSTALLWGSGDFFTRPIASRIGPYSSAFFMQFIGIFVLGIYLWITGEMQHVLMTTSGITWVWAVLAVILNTIGTVSLHRAFASGTVSIVSPITSSYAAITALLSIFSGERITLLHAAGMGCILIGVIFISAPVGSMLRRKSDKQSALISRKSIFWAIIAALGYGTAFWMLGFHVSRELGSVFPVWLIRILTPILLLMCAPILQQKIVRPKGKEWLMVGMIDLLATSGYIIYTFGQINGQIATITVLSSLYSVFTVLLAFLFLREKLQHSQWISMIIIFAGIVCVNL